MSVRNKNLTLNLRATSRDYLFGFTNEPNVIYIREGFL